jgi:hypothetical protein
MSARPYAIVRQASSLTIHQGNNMAVLVEFELADRVAHPLEETLSFQTRVPLPLPSGQSTIEIAALIRVRASLDAQIAAMTQSP